MNREVLSESLRALQERFRQQPASCVLFITMPLLVGVLVVSVVCGILPLGPPPPPSGTPPTPSETASPPIAGSPTPTALATETPPTPGETASPTATPFITELPPTPTFTATASPTATATGTATATPLPPPTSSPTPSPSPVPTLPSGGWQLSPNGIGMGLAALFGAGLVSLIALFRYLRLR